MSRELELITAAAVADGRPGPRAAQPGDGPKHADVHAECLNCGAVLHGRFCAQCGQQADDHHRSILHLAWEAVEGFTHLDGRLAQTLPALFLRPGSLARDHFEGRRQRHVPPFRLFLVSLLLFMLALEFLVHRGASQVEKVREAVRVAPRPVAVAPAAATSGGGARPGSAPAVSIAVRAPEAPRIDPAYQVSAPEADAAQKTLETMGDGDPIAALAGTHAGQTPIGRWFIERAKAVGVSPEYFITVMFEWAHRLAVLLLPIFAALLTLCYCYRRRFYVYDHLVVSMQFLSFIFLVSAAAWVTPAPVGAFAIAVATLWTPVNLFMILRGAYGSSVAGALVKAAALWISALFLFLFLLVGILVVTLGQMH